MMGNVTERIEQEEVDLDVATICLEHITDQYLRDIAGLATERRCSFCARKSDESAFAVQFEPIFDCFMDTFWAHNTRPEEAPIFEGESYGLEWTDSQVGILATAGFDDAVIDEVTALIAKSIGEPEVGTFFSSMAMDDLELTWADFTRTAQHVSRFVIAGEEGGRSPMARFSVFLDQLRSSYVDGDFSLVRTMELGTHLYRGRLVEDPHRKLPVTAAELGPAPAKRASASRMSPAGIPMFYCSADPMTAIAEISGHGVEPYAVIGEFVSQRELYILDLTKTLTQPSPFNSSYRGEARMLSFLHMFAADVARPVIPDQRQHIEYAPTQLLTEFFRWAPDREIDGIQLSSSQTGAATYVLFVGPEDIVDIADFSGEPRPAQPPFTLFGKSFEDPTIDEPAGAALTLDPDRVQVYRVNRRVDPESVAERMGDTWVSTKPSSPD
jgi:hypothetical protein